MMFIPAFRWSMVPLLLIQYSGSLRTAVTSFPDHKAACNCGAKARQGRLHHWSGLCRLKMDRKPWFLPSFPFALKNWGGSNKFLLSWDFTLHFQWCCNQQHHVIALGDKIIPQSHQCWTRVMVNHPFLEGNVVNQHKTSNIGWFQSDTFLAKSGWLI